MREIELKFDVAPRDHEAVRRAPLLKGVRARRQRLHAIYFDTPDHRLAKNGLALRVRREGRRWIQCLKGGRTGEAGLHARDEWEVPRRDATIDAALFAGTPLDAVLPTPAARKRLRPVFTVGMDRTTWSLDLDGSGRVEVALDRGEVRHGKRRSPISELEIESLAGDPAAVFRAADALVERVALRPSAVSKAQRGYALARGARAHPAKARAVELERHEAPGRAAQRIVAAALAQLQANEAPFIGADDDEYLHQFRVGLRRLRTALRVFRDAFDADMAREMRADCRWISRVTGEARDRDVFVSTVLPALRLGKSAAARKLMRGARAARAQARQAAREALRSPRYSRFVLRFARWLASEPPANRAKLRTLAASVLERGHRKAMHGVRRLAAMTPAQRHRVRIRLKRLRYACEALASLYGRKRAARYVRALTKLQQDLGRAADALASLALLQQLEPPASLARRARARLEAQAEESLAPAMRHVKALRAARPFWR
ncbi:MAG TPA: CHAD domain-containing protein [Usitatibacter sp.]|nr:CHAD domain-containing protein [Usitatibacter sp.]